MATIKNWAGEIGFYDDPSKQFKRVLLYSETGGGKTKLASTFPDPFFIDTDKGGKTLKDLKIPNIKLTRGNKSFDEIMDILGKIKRKEEPFNFPIGTIVLDSITTLADFLIVDILKYPKSPGKVSRDITKVKPEWDDYTVLTAELKAITKYIQDMDINVVATCGVKLEKDEIRGTFVGLPDILGSFRNAVGYEFDELYFMEVKTKGKDVEYVTHFQKISYFSAKSREGKKGFMVNATFDKLFVEQEKNNNIKEVK